MSPISQPGWFVLLPLALFPAANSLPDPYRSTARFAVLSAALIAWAWSMRRSRRGAVALLGKSAAGAGTAVWELCLFAFVVAIAVIYFVLAARLHEIVYNDGAYYYGVARHMAQTGRFEEPIVWHFLHPPERIVHAPFDYWGCMTSLILAPALALFGTTPETAFLTMCAISAASVLAFWYLISFALPLRYQATQLLALVIFALSPAMDIYRFQPESTAIAQLFLLASLIAFCRRRYVLALLCGFGIFLARGDGLILFSLIFAAVVLRASRDQPHAAGKLLLVGIGCLGTYAAWSLVSFGTLTPPGQRELPLLARYLAVFDYGTPHESLGTPLLRWFTWSNVVSRIRGGFDSLRLVPFAPASDWWLALALLPALYLFRRSALEARLIWLLCFGGYFLLVCVAGPGFAPWRAPHTFTPLIVLAGALGIDVLLTGLEAWTGRGTDWRRPILAGAAVLALSALFLSRLTPFQQTKAPRNLPGQQRLAALDQILHGEAVASNVPWYMIAYTRSPTVSIPYNGEAAIDAVLERYQVRWLVIAAFHAPLWVTGASVEPLRRILVGDKTNLGRFQLERVPFPAWPAVYRVHALVAVR